MGEVAPSNARGRRGQVCAFPLALSDASLRSRHLSHEWERRKGPYLNALASAGQVAEIKCASAVALPPMGTPSHWVEPEALICMAMGV